MLLEQPLGRVTPTTNRNGQERTRPDEGGLQMSIRRLRVIRRIRVGARRTGTTEVLNVVRPAPDRPDDQANARWYTSSVLRRSSSVLNDVRII
jgi:hypothetical protein